MENFLEKKMFSLLRRLNLKVTNLWHQTNQKLGLGTILEII